MQINELGEFNLIKELTKNIKLQNKSTLIGVGDDCAVLDFKNKQCLATTDILLEGIHFDLTYTPLKHLGYKAAMVNISDICAMNGKPTQLLVSLGISQRFTVEMIEDIYSGLYLACEKAGVDLVGGDTSSSLTGLTISVTCLGEVEKGKAVLRSGANVSDLICTTGDFGAAYMGLQLLEREKQVFQAGQDSDFQPDFAGKEYVLERQLKPEARFDSIKFLAENGVVPTAMMDVSDGLSSELLHICTASKLGCRIYEDKIPIDYQTALMADEFSMNLTTVALNGGEDYELLFTVPVDMYDKVAGLEDIHVIGYTTAPEDGCALITRDNQEMTIKAQGWKAFDSEK